MAQRFNNSDKKRKRIRYIKRWKESPLPHLWIYGKTPFTMEKHKGYVDWRLFCSRICRRYDSHSPYRHNKQTHPHCPTYFIRFYVGCPLETMVRPELNRRNRSTRRVCYRQQFTKNVCFCSFVPNKRHPHFRIRQTLTSYRKL